jgi:hypothetical protein
MNGEKERDRQGGAAADKYDHRPRNGGDGEDGIKARSRTEHAERQHCGVQQKPRL